MQVWRMHVKQRGMQDLTVKLFSGASTEAAAANGWQEGKCPMAQALSSYSSFHPDRHASGNTSVYSHHAPPSLRPQAYAKPIP